ncbi:MAG: FecR domain-containing protein [Oscillospiraceae bacterium]|nr:FecR domain-containing protein [Oscillospiraceae bacterium]
MNAGTITVLSVKVKVIIACVAVAAVTGAAVAIGTILNSEEAYRVLKVFELAGEASVSREGTGDIDAYVGMNLESGDVLTVDEESTMRISLDEDKYILLDGGTVMELYATGTAEDSKTAINLKQGTILNELTASLSSNSSYEVSTPKATMAVRGTSFMVSVEQDEDGSYIIQTAVFHGKVETVLLDEEGNPTAYKVMVTEDKSVSIRTEPHESSGNPAEIDGTSFFIYLNGDGTYTAVPEGGDPISDTAYEFIPSSVIERALSSNDSGIMELDGVIVRKMRGDHSDSQVSASESETSADTSAETSAETAETSADTSAETISESESDTASVTAETVETAVSTLSETEVTTVSAAEEAEVTTVPAVEETEVTTVPTTEETEVTTVPTIEETTRNTDFVTWTEPETTAETTEETEKETMVSSDFWRPTTNTGFTTPSHTGTSNVWIPVITTSSETSITTSDTDETSVTAETTEETDDYTVSFVCDGKLIGEVTVSEGETVSAIPAVPEKTGYTGVWMYNGAEFSTDTVVTSDITVEAEYIANACVVTFKAEGSADITRTVSYGETAADIPEVPEKTGYTGVWMYNGAEFSTDTVVTSDITVEAEYIVNACVVTFKAEGYEDITRTVSYGETVADIPDVPEKTGYMGVWMYDGAEFTSSAVITEDIEVTAEYTINEYTVNYVASFDNSIILDSVTVKHGEVPEIITPDVVYGSNEYYLWGWEEVRAGISAVTEDTDIAVPYVPYDEIGEVKIVIDGNTLISKLYRDGDTIDLPVVEAADAAPENMEFSGWGITCSGGGFNSGLKEGSGTVYDSENYDYSVQIAEAGESSLTLSVSMSRWGDGNIAIVPRYEAVKVNVTFKAPNADESYEKVVQVPYGGSLKSYEPAVPTKTGYTGKWTLNGSEYTQSYGVTGEIEVVAEYTINTYKVRYVTSYDEYYQLTYVNVNYGEKPPAYSPPKTITEADGVYTLNEVEWAKITVGPITGDTIITVPYEKTS